MVLLASSAKHILYAEKATLIRGAVMLDNTMFALLMISSCSKNLGLLEFLDGILRIKQVSRRKEFCFISRCNMMPSLEGC